MLKTHKSHSECAALKRFFIIALCLLFTTISTNGLEIFENYIQNNNSSETESNSNENSENNATTNDVGNGVPDDGPNNTSESSNGENSSETENSTIDNKNHKKIEEDEMVPNETETDFHDEKDARIISPAETISGDIDSLIFVYDSDEGLNNFAYMTVICEPPDVSDPRIIWSSSNFGVAGFGDDGGSVEKVTEANSVTGIAKVKIVFKKIGKVAISAEAADSSQIFSTYVIDVIPEIKKITINDAVDGKLNLKAKKAADSEVTKLLSVTTQPSEIGGNSLVYSIKSFSKNYKSSDITVNQMGLVEVNTEKSGSAILTVKPKYKPNDESDVHTDMKIIVEKTVDAEDELIENLNFEPNEINIDINSTITLNPKITPKTAKNKSLRWTILNDSYSATIDEFTGELTSSDVTEDIYIKATAQDGSNKSATCLVHVIKMTQKIRFDKQRINLWLSRRRTKQLEIAIFPEDSSNKKLRFVSDNPEIAEVNEDGIVTGNSPGITIIRAETTDGSAVYDVCICKVSTMSTIEIIVLILILTLILSVIIFLIYYLKKVLKKKQTS